MDPNTTQKLASVLESEFGQVCGAKESPEETAIRLLRSQVASLSMAEEENFDLSNRNLMLLGQNEALQAAQLRYNAEVATLVKSLEKIDPGLGLKTINNVVIYAAEQLDKQAVDIGELQEDLKSAEEEAARFSKQCRLVSTRNTELLAEAKEANAAAFRTATRNEELLAEVSALKAAQLSPTSKTASPLDRSPGDPPLDLKSALDRANKMAEANVLAGDTIDLTTITKAPLTGDTFETFANYFIIESVVSLDRLTGKNNDAMGKIFGSKDKIAGAAILLMINGVVVPFLDVLRRFHSQWNHIVKQTAIEYMSEQFGEKTSDIFALLDELKSRLETTLGVNDGCE